jgi:hypothetical protein
MKNIIYRTQFRIDSTGQSDVDRDSKLDNILSSMENFDSSEKINPPSVNSTIEIDNQDYIITKIKYSFYHENDNIVYATILEIIKEKTKAELEKNKKKAEDDILFQKVKDLDKIIMNNNRKDFGEIVASIDFLNK